MKNTMIAVCSSVLLLTSGTVPVSAESPKNEPKVSHPIIIVDNAEEKAVSAKDKTAETGITDRIPSVGNYMLSEEFTYCEPKWMRWYGQYSNPYIVIGSGNMQSNGCVPTAAAMLLSAYVFADAYLRGVGDVKEMYEVLEEECASADYNDFRCKGREKRTTHTLDLYEGEMCLALLADAVGEKEYAAALREDYKNFVCVYSNRTGLLQKNSWYYEGNFLNYSFRLHSDGNMRITAAGGKEKFLKLLDYFFGYRLPHIGYGKFEGFNNETDMEAPFSYHFIGRHDRISEMIDMSRKYMWTLSRGGMPGNNDTGALSSLYVWNALGLFPVSGQDRLIAGSPLFKHAVVHLKDGDIELIKEGAGIYVGSMEVNGKSAPELECAATELRKGGKVVFYCREGKNE